ncbi:conserved hypothetical protein [Escherichia phage AR1]|uniref:Uncharacterized protein n=1 Tax=Escherichia phage AR1 TaxID=66711 RepID=D4ZA08_BPAR1|nr:hypothetical protein AR1_213 [Escherichia phage AR1]BAI83220.1 conserved hypothetical protein [Escherichia phage AR1]
MFPKANSINRTCNTIRNIFTFKIDVVHFYSPRCLIAVQVYNIISCTKVNNYFTTFQCFMSSLPTFFIFSIKRSARWRAVT